MVQKENLKEKVYHDSMHQKRGTPFMSTFEGTEGN
jgi:hypothetical protein